MCYLRELVFWEYQDELVWVDELDDTGANFFWIVNLLPGSGPFGCGLTPQDLQASLTALTFLKVRLHCPDYR